MYSAEIEHIFKLMDLDTPEKRKKVLSNVANQEENKDKQEYVFIKTSGNTEQLESLEVEDARLERHS